MKSCKADNCNNLVWGGGYCQRHQYLRTDKSPAPARKSPLRSVMKPTGELETFKSVIKTFMEADTKKELRSFLSGIKITVPTPANMAHVLSKKQYPQYRLYERNIVPLLFEEHGLYDQGTEDDREQYAKKHRCYWNKIYVLREALKYSYPDIIDKDFQPLLCHDWAPGMVINATNSKVLLDTWKILFADTYIGRIGLNIYFLEVKERNPGGNQWLLQCVSDKFSAAPFVGTYQECYQKFLEYKAEITNATANAN